MSRIQIISNSQIVKVNWIDGYLYACELKGGHSQIFREARIPEYHSHILVQRGTLYYIFNGKDGEVHQGDLLNVPSWTKISYMKYSPDFVGMIVSVNNGLVMDIFRNRNPFPPHLGFRVRDIDSISLSAKESRIIAQDMGNLLGALGNKVHHFAKELNYAHYYILLTDFADVIWRKYGEGNPIHSVEISRMEKILNDFIVLVESNIEKETNIGFYADALCISKQYLSLIVRKKVHVSVGYFLARIRYEKAARLLLDTTLTIQQVSDRLSFADQSSFGKFFKKHGGKSPLSYRKDLKKNLLTMRDEMDVR